MKTKVLPPFYYRRRHKSALAKFIFDHEPETIDGSRKFRALLVRVLNEAQGARWVEACGRNDKAQQRRPG